MLNTLKIALFSLSVMLFSTQLVLAAKTDPTDCPCYTEIEADILERSCADYTQYTREKRPNGGYNKQLRIPGEIGGQCLQLAVGKNADGTGSVLVNHGEQIVTGGCTNYELTCDYGIGGSNDPLTADQVKACGVVFSKFKQKANKLPGCTSCLAFSGGGDICVNGNYVTDETSGSFPMYLIPDGTSCPTGTFFNGTIGASFFPEIQDFLYDLGFAASDQLCTVDKP